MSRVHAKFPGPGSSVLLALAAPIEAQAVFAGAGVSWPEMREWATSALVPGVDVVLTGIGKSNAAGAVARWLSQGSYEAVISIGIGGCLPGRAYRAGERLLAEASVFADEGVDTGSEFLTTAQIGFAMPGVGDIAITPDERLVRRLEGLVEGRGRIATVSTCSGTDARARSVAARTGAVCEAMEGAAVGLVAHRLGLAFAEVRVISNTTGERSGQKWDIRIALESLREFARAFVNSDGSRSH